MSDISDEAGGYIPPGATYFWQQPPPAGYWQISGNLQIHVEKRPNWFHKWMNRMLIGWIWHDANL